MHRRWPHGATRSNRDRRNRADRCRDAPSCAMLHLPLAGSLPELCHFCGPLLLLMRNRVAAGLLRYNRLNST
ncbi:hypothetical protein IE4872_PD01030 (plasmid) [Rhizobium gallicum]|uniref:Uncharacterized protein n=1 Tax=Rhizobium gallicum TaxID=56730 RepID=A0A1L5NUH3_9HYPH|nr:hypothetical protein IE4872_PD01030 [Rhizobium gallicum]